MKTLGQRLKEHREIIDWTQKDLQAVSGINHMQISHFESDRRMPSLRNAVKLCQALNCSMDWLVRGIRNGSE